jgi:AcrR family transcriptional regulator
VTRYRQVVPEPGTQPDAQSPELARLPPGRHGLPREFVVQNQRDRLTAGMIAVVAERGYHAATITGIAAAAGVSRRTFYAYFDSKEDCYLATYDIIAEHLYEVGAEAAATEQSWPRRVRAVLAAVLGSLAANPDLARFVLIEPNRTGGRIAGRLRTATEPGLAELDRSLPKDVKAPSREVQNALLAGMVALIARLVEAGEGERLEGLLPELAELLLTPYVGRDEAAAVARGA